MSQEQQLCPGVGGRRCGAFISPLFRDPHPTCATCRGIKCTADMTSDICKDWSVAQWEAFLKKHPYSGHRKSRPSGSAVPTAPPTLLPSASASRSMVVTLPLLLRVRQRTTAVVLSTLSIWIGMLLLGLCFTSSGNSSLCICFFGSWAPCASPSSSHPSVRGAWLYGGVRGHLSHWLLWGFECLGFWGRV